MGVRGHVEDLTGQKYGRLTFIRFLHTDEKRKSVWLLRCECGTELTRRSNAVKTGNTKSCGCQKSDSSRERGYISIKNAVAATVTHSLTGTRIYRIWKNMKGRCLNSNVPCYPLYGGRGITICDEWVNDAGAFAEWAAANGYADNLEIDRIDNDGPYSPANCRWATRQQQTNNQNRNRRITHNGRTQTAAMWARELGYDSEMIYSRIAAGWEESDLLLPRHGKRRR